MNQLCRRRSRHRRHHLMGFYLFSIKTFITHTLFLLYIQSKWETSQCNDVWAHQISQCKQWVDSHRNSFERTQIRLTRNTQLQFSRIGWFFIYYEFARKHAIAIFSVSFLFCVSIISNSAKICIKWRKKVELLKLFHTLWKNKNRKMKKKENTSKTLSINLRYF